MRRDMNVRLLKKLLVPILVSLLFWEATVFGREPSDPFPFLASSYLVKIDGRIVWAKDIHKRMPPASLTKIMTALIALEKTKPDEVVQVSKAAAMEDGSKIRLKAGDRLRAMDLICAALIYSANDACKALAEHIGGNEANFVRMMNQRAQRMGLRNTHFVNSCGHDHPNHYSSAYDLMILTEVAMRNPTFVRIVSTQNMEIRTIDGRRVFRLENKNKLIGSYPGVIGVKTGYTDRAGRCLVAWAERGSRRVLMILLNAPHRWYDAPFVLDMAFDF